MLVTSPRRNSLLAMLVREGKVRTHSVAPVGRRAAVAA
jgi:hypothetical protein